MPNNSENSLVNGLANAASYANLTREIAPWGRATGFRTNSSRFRTLSESNQTRLAEEFLLNSKLLRNNPETGGSVAGYLSDPSMVMLSMLGEERSNSRRETSLPQSIKLQMGLTEAIRRRRSVRSYTGDSIGLDCLATLVRAAAGVTGIGEVQLASGSTASLKFRSAPSGGGLYPVDLFVAALRVRGLDRAVYQYNSKRDVLLHCQGADSVDQILSSLAGPEDFISIANANLIFLLVGRLWRSMRKYGARGLRFLFIEAGAIAENLNLASIALGLGSLDCASFYDDEVHEAMGLDGLYASLLHTVVMGQAG